MPEQRGQLVGRVRAGMTFTADAELCGAQAGVAGVAEAQVGFVATFPGSPFFNETLAGQIAFLPLSDTRGGQRYHHLCGPCGRTARRAATTASARGGRCPATGQQGHLGSGPYFDGSDDAIEIPDSGPISISARAISRWRCG